MRCELCNKDTRNKKLYTIDKQIGGKFKRLKVCRECKEDHERELEMTRENFWRQFKNE